MTRVLEEVVVAVRPYLRGDSVRTRWDGEVEVEVRVAGEPVHRARMLLDADHATSYLRQCLDLAERQVKQHVLEKAP